MRSGDLRYTLLFLQPVRTLDRYGRTVTDWQELCTVKGAAHDVSGREFYEAAAHQLENVITFDIRWRPDVTTACRIRFRGIDHEILQINHLGYQGDYLRIRARSVAPEG